MSENLLREKLKAEAAAPRSAPQLGAPGSSSSSSSVPVGVAHGHGHGHGYGYGHGPGAWFAGGTPFGAPFGMFGFGAGVNTGFSFPQPVFPSPAPQASPHTAAVPAATSPKAPAAPAPVPAGPAPAAVAAAGSNVLMTCVDPKGTLFLHNARTYELVDQASPSDHVIPLAPPSTTMADFYAESTVAPGDAGTTYAEAWVEGKLRRLIQKSPLWKDIVPKSVQPLIPTCVAWPQPAVPCRRTSAAAAQRPSQLASWATLVLTAVLCPCACVMHV